MFRHILAPVDFSPLSAAGLRYAAEFARCTQGRITVLFANPFTPPPYFTQGKIEQMEQQYREGMREAEAQLHRFAEEAIGEPRPDFGIQVVEALPVDGIMGAAANLGADLITMGTHGRSGLNRFMLGSVAERVIRQADIPVLTVRGGEGRPRIRSIICPVAETVAPAAMATAALLARCTGASLRVLHVREHGAPDPLFPEGVEVMVREGDAAEQIVAASGDCDLLVIGSRHRRFFDTTVIGATTARVVRHARCPVLTVVEAEAGINSEAEA
ncbi:MAG: universal stress protein [Bryobacteraceae bacterium]